jgi:hypothetical protein
MFCRASLGFAGNGSWRVAFQANGFEVDRMVKVFFQVHRGGTVIPDLEGVEFQDLALAKKDAEAALHEILAEDIGHEQPLQQTSITIMDEHRNVLATVQLKAAVRMVQETKN